MHDRKRNEVDVPGKHQQLAQVRVPPPECSLTCRPGAPPLVVGLEVDQLRIATLTGEHRAHELLRLAEVGAVPEETEQDVVARRVRDPHQG